MFELNKNNIKKILFIIFIALILYFSLQNINFIIGVLSTALKLLNPLIIGICIAFLVNIPLKKIETLILKVVNKNKKEKNKREVVSKITRIFSLLISFLIILGIIFMVTFLIIPELINAFNLIKENIPSVVNDTINWIKNMLNNYPEIQTQISEFKIDWDSINNNINNFVKNNFSVAITSSINFIVAFSTGIVNFFMGIIFAIYLLLQKETFLKQLKKLVLAYIPEKRAKAIFEISSLSNKIFSNFLGGQFIEAFILGLLCFIGMSIFGFPYALTISVLIGFTALIPFFGPLIGMLIGAILILVNSPTSAFWFIVFILILQQLEGNFIYPKVVGNSVGLPGIWVILAVTLGGSLFGILGMLIGVPIASILYTLLRKNVNQNISKKDIDINEYIDEDEENLNKTKFKKFSSKKKENKNKK